MQAVEISSLTPSLRAKKKKNHNRGLFTLVVAGERVIESRSRQWCYFVGRGELSTELLDVKINPQTQQDGDGNTPFVAVWKVWGEWVIGTEVLKSGFLLKGSKCC